MSQIVPVILCGGSGSRLWPFSRSETPKQFLKLFNGFTLLQNTAKRTIEILGRDHPDIVIVTLASLAEETRRQLVEVSPTLANHILHEPVARNTAAAVALAMQYVREKFGDESFMWILPADHFIGETTALKAAAEQALNIAKLGQMVTFGIHPTRAETGYGYIKRSTPLNESVLSGITAYSVEEFVEKPDVKTAEEFIAQGDYLWSSGMHLFRTNSGIDCFDRHAPEIFSEVKAAAKDGSFAFPETYKYERIAKKPFETAVMEKADNIAVVASNPKWSDVGSWESLWEIKDKDACGNAFEGRVFSEGTENSLVISKNRLVACVGVKDLIIIEMDDAVLVADKKSSASLKALVENLKSLQIQEMRGEQPAEHPWGMTETIMDENRFAMRELRVSPQRSIDGIMRPLGTQFFVVDGAGQISSSLGQTPLRTDDNLELDLGTSYTIINDDSKELIIYELVDKHVASTGGEKKNSAIMGHLPQPELRRVNAKGH